MTFEEVLNEALAMRKRQGRVLYRALKRQVDLDEDYLDDLKEALGFSHSQAQDEEGRELVRTGEPEPLPNTHHETGSESRIQALIPEVMTFLQGHRRVTYRRLSVIFGLNDDLLDQLRY